MRNLLILLLFAIGASNILAQKDTLKSKTNLIGISSGYGYCRYIDPTESANTYLGNYMPIRFTLTSFNNKYIDRFSFVYSSADLSCKGSTDWNRTSFDSRYFQINYNYHRKIVDINKAKFFIGGGINGYVSWRTLNYNIPGNMISLTNGDFFIQANVSVAAKIQQKSNLLLLNLSNSAISYYFPSLFRTGQKDGRFAGFPKFNVSEFNIDYMLKMYEHFFFNLGYSFYYYRYPRMGDVSITKGSHNQFLLGINFKF